MRLQTGKAYQNSLRFQWYTQNGAKFLKLNTEALHRRASAQGRRLQPIPIAVYVLVIHLLITALCGTVTAQTQTDPARNDIAATRRSNAAAISPLPQ